VQSTGVIAGFSGVATVLEMIAADFPDFRPQGPFPGGLLNIDVPQLTELLAIDTITYAYTTVSGTLPAKLAGNQQAVAAVIGKLIDVPPLLTAEVSIGFGERSSKQSRRDCDRITWKTRSGKSLLGYHATSSKMRSDIEYRRAAFACFIAEARLPLAIRDVSDGFMLDRMSPGLLDIHIAGGFNDENPSSFSCEIETTDAECLGALLVKSIEVLGSGKLFEYRWSVGNDLQGRLPDAITDGVDVLRFASTAGVSAERYELRSHVTIGSLNDLELLRAILPAAEEIVVQVGAFRFDADMFANVRVRTGSSGYRIELESRHPIPASLAARYAVAP
jgi:hypothetical protein